MEGIAAKLYVQSRGKVQHVPCVRKPPFSGWGTPVTIQGKERKVVWISTKIAMGLAFERDVVLLGDFLNSRFSYSEETQELLIEHASGVGHTQTAYSCRGNRALSGGRVFSPDQLKVKVGNGRWLKLSCSTLGMDPTVAEETEPTVCVKVLEYTDVFISLRDARELCTQLPGLGVEADKVKSSADLVLSYNPKTQDVVLAEETSFRVTQVSLKCGELQVLGTRQAGSGLFLVGRRGQPPAYINRAAVESLLNDCGIRKWRPEEGEPPQIDWTGERMSVRVPADAAREVLADLQPEGAVTLLFVEGTLSRVHHHGLLPPGEHKRGGTASHRRSRVHSSSQPPRIHLARTRGKSSQPMRMARNLLSYVSVTGLKVGQDPVQERKAFVLEDDPTGEVLVHVDDKSGFRLSLQQVQEFFELESIKDPSTVTVIYTDGVLHLKDWSAQVYRVPLVLGDQQWTASRRGIESKRNAVPVIGAGRREVYLKIPDANAMLKAMGLDVEVEDPNDLTIKWETTQVLLEFWQGCRKEVLSKLLGDKLAQRAIAGRLCYDVEAGTFEVIHGV